MGCFYKFITNFHILFGLLGGGLFVRGTGFLHCVFKAEFGVVFSDFGEVGVPALELFRRGHCMPSAKILILILLI